MKKILVISIFILAISTSFVRAAGIIPDTFHLVPCGLNGTMCTPCDLWTLGSNIINFALYGLSLPVLTVLLLIAGIMMVFGGSSESTVTAAHKLLWSAVIGILISFGAWLIVNTIINTLAEGRPTAAWNSISCPANIFNAPPATLPSQQAAPVSQAPQTIPSQGNQTSASILQRDGITFVGGGSCKDTSGNPVGAATNLTEIQNSQPLTTCQSGCSSNSLLTCFNKVSLNPAVLGALVATERGTGVKFQITSLTTGDHAANSDHYQGNAADIQPLSQTQNNYVILRDQLRAFSGPSNRVECENNAGVAIATCGVGTTHVHASFK